MRKEKAEQTQAVLNSAHQEKYVVTRNGQIVCQTIEALRYPAEIEIQMLESGYIITIGGKKLTKKSLRNS